MNSRKKWMLCLNLTSVLFQNGILRAETWCVLFCKERDCEIAKGEEVEASSAAEAENYSTVIFRLVFCGNLGAKMFMQEQPWVLVQKNDMVDQ